MAWIDICVVGQAEQTFDDIRTELLIVATREIGATDAAAEERVAREDPAFNHSIKADTTHGMARRADDFLGALPYFNDFAIF